MDNKKNKQKPVIDIKKEVEEWRNKYLRALADYQNLEKRMQEERYELLKMGDLQLLLKLLPFLDHLEKAEVFVKDKGLMMVKDSFMQILKDMGIKEIEVLDREYDPRLAEAIDTVVGDEDNLVVEVLRKGYEYEGKILRVAQVKVSKKLK